MTALGHTQALAFSSESNSLKSLQNFICGYFIVPSSGEPTSILGTIHRYFSDKHLKMKLIQKILSDGESLAKILFLNFCLRHR